MAFFTNLFGGKKTLSHHAKTLVDFFRASAPTSLKKLSDTDIYDAAQEVMGLADSTCKCNTLKVE